MSIPLVQNNEKDSINTSIIAIKRNIERINMLLGLSNSEEIDTSKFATKEELQQAVTDLQPVDEVTVGNMHSVTSNAVAEAIGEWTKVKSNAPLSEKYDLTGVKEFYLEWTNGHSTAIGYYYLPVIESNKTKYTVVGNDSNTIGVGAFNIDSNLLLTVYAGSWAQNYSLWVKK